MNFLCLILRIELYIDNPYGDANVDNGEQSMIVLVLWYLCQMHQQAVS